ncbi:DNA topoisomerase IB [Mesonia maritima]|uniref:DNA topoisomerase n=1 Tax=Mesonia maritima TaxID=1793873 RepID=A0ABU1K805_9FLAO|nr:DNA topoisomerase IB [Mesonia maritima]MDR6301390.1 DNA topoisomerase-1 [Mesonia maritima]
MAVAAQKIDTLLAEPQQIADYTGLVYITDEKLTIQRHKHGREFYYTDKEGNKVCDEKCLSRIKSLVIPPAWRNVRITHLENGHLQVVGRDDKERKVYRYHDEWSKIKNQTKFFKMISFGEALPAIREQVEKDLKLKGMPKQKVLALVIRLMEETHIRIGNQYYAKTNHTYGLSTLRSKHVDLHDEELTFNFVGKKGKEHHIDIHDAQLIELVNQCEEIPGWELFKYYDEDGEKHSIDSGLINEYIQDLSGAYFSAKDFRTWSATKIFFESLKDLEIPETKKHTQKNLIQAYDETAEALGNTRSVCKNYYVHPLIAEKYEEGTLTDSFEKLEKNKSKKVSKKFSQTEEVLLELIKEFQININS